jgi:hypothetical protein
VRRDAGALWAITAYFNPAGYTRRIVNYRVFRAHLAVPLVAVELSFDGHFELQRQDADILVQIRGDSVLWQKERLLNVGLTYLPGACRYVAWIDCDVIFDRDDWAVRAIDALETFDLVHLFHEAHDLPRGVDLDRLDHWDAPPSARSVVHKMTAGEAVPHDFFLDNAPIERRPTPGLAWASPRAVLDRHGLYDASILGGGDRLILLAALGKFSYGRRASLRNTRQLEHYLRWARPYHDTVRGRVAHVEGRLFHLWHGIREDRQYRERHRGLEQFEFDPFTDIAKAETGCWRWSSDKSALHAFVKRYFEARNEDGEPTEAPVTTVRTPEGARR